MGGKSKKKSASKKNPSQQPGRYVVTPASPAVTRSTAPKSPSDASAKKVEGASASARKDGGVPKAAPVSALAQAAEGASASPYQVSIEDLGARMAQMESAVRAVLTSVSVATSTAPVPAATPASTPAATPAAAPPAESGDSNGLTRGARPSSRDSSVGHRRRRRRHRSSSSSASRSSSSSSTSRSSSESVSPARSSRRSRRKQDKRDKKRKGKYDTSSYLRDGDKLNTYERLVLANLKMMRKLYKSERDVLGFLDHMILIAEKAERRVFASEALISYDESVKENAKESGLKAFKVLDPANIVKHLSYDGTQVAVNSRRTNSTRQSSTRTPNLNHNFACIKFNFAQGGCKAGQSCRYKHICSACGGPGHSNGDCPNVDRDRSSAAKK